MKCPSCGYENREDARYCNLCQTSFIKAQPESPRLVAPPLLRKEVVSEGEATELNWFQRHLNWTWVLPQLLLYIIGVIVFYKSFSDILNALVSSSESSFVSAVSTWVSFWFIWPVIGLSAEFGIGAWVLKRKKRSLWWLSIFLIPAPFGWFLYEWSAWPAIAAYIIVVIIFLCLDNGSEPSRVAVSNPARLGLEVQRLKSQSDKYWW